MKSLPIQKTPRGSRGGCAGAAAGVDSGSCKAASRYRNPPSDRNHGPAYAWPEFPSKLTRIAPPPNGLPSAGELRSTNFPRESTSWPICLLTRSIHGHVAPG